MKPTTNYFCRRLTVALSMKAYLHRYLFGFPDIVGVKARTRILGWRSCKSICLMTSFAALLMLLGLPCFGIESMLHPFVIFFGLPCIYGLTIGQGIIALYHGFGPIDFITPVLMFPMKYLMLKRGCKLYLVHAIALGVWLPILQCLIGKYPFAGLPFFILLQTIGEVFWQSMGVILLTKIGRRYRIS